VLQLGRFLKLGLYTSWCNIKVAAIDMKCTHGNLCMVTLHPIVWHDEMGTIGNGP
jgi:hypothetical protein